MNILGKRGTQLPYLSNEIDYFGRFQFKDHCCKYLSHNAICLVFWQQKINRVPLLIINNFHVKFESDRTKTAVCIVPTMFYTQSTNIDLALWPRDAKSIGFLLSSSTTYMWRLIVTVICILPTRQNATDGRTHPTLHEQLYHIPSNAVARG